MRKKKPAKRRLRGLFVGLFGGVLLSGLLAEGAVRKNSYVTPSQSVVRLLAGPFQGAVEAMYKKGPAGYKILRELAFSDQHSVKTRWKAFMALTQIGGRASLPEIDRALDSDQWFLRNAGLVALEKIHFVKAARRAKKMFVQDKALLVRAKALEVLHNSPTRKVRRLLWKQLYAKKNYYRGQSLWIRKHIARYLAQHGKKSDLKSFLRLVESEDLEDRELKPLVFPAMERLLGVSAKKSLSTQGKVAFWTQRLKKTIR